MEEHVFADRGAVSFFRHDVATLGSSLADGSSTQTPYVSDLRANRRLSQPLRASAKRSKRVRLTCHAIEMIARKER